MIDSGEGRPQWIAALKGVLQKENASISQALLTHWHPDHVGGAEDLLQYSPETKIYKNKSNPTAGRNEIVDGQKFQVEGASLTALFCPGHANDHMAFILEEENAMFTGDNVLGHGTAVFEDLTTYLESLEKMQHAFYGRAYPGHGQSINDGKGRILEYIRHRQDRENQVLQVMRSSAPNGDPQQWEAIDIVKIIYKDVPESLHLPAHGGVLQILGKLRNEDKVVHDPKTQMWSIHDSVASL